MKKELKYSEMDSAYYAMVIKSPYMESKNENPLVNCTESYEDTVVYTLADKTKKGVKFLDFYRESFRLYISDRISEKLRDFFGSPKEGEEQKKTFVDLKPVYFKDDEGKLHKYFGFCMPRQDFLDIKQTGKGYEVTNVVFRAMKMKKTPEAERSIFELDFHKYGWRYCNDEVKNLIESLNATGVKFEKSCDWDWAECAKLETYD